MQAESEYTYSVPELPLMVTLAELPSSFLTHTSLEYASTSDEDVDAAELQIAADVYHVSTRSPLRTGWVVVYVTFL